MLANIVSRNPSTNVVPGQVNGNWAVWKACSPAKCVVYRRDIHRRRQDQQAGESNTGAIPTVRPLG